MSTPLHFGRFEVRPTQRAVLRDGQPLPVGARAFDVLMALLHRAGELVTKEQLLDQAWPGLVVEEANVHVQVSQLRKWLGAEAIGTVAGLGYRFTLPLDGGPARHNLPAERTGFIGRDTALAEAQSRLATARLLTLIGIGGTGKTRLALKLAERCAAAGGTDVVWVDLAPVEAAEPLLPTVAQAAGCPLRASEVLQATLASHLGRRPTLLVLDNCEHLLDAVASLAATLLDAAPALRLVATSREALGLPGESVLPVRPLDLPAPGCSPASALEAEAVRLFLQRAEAASPGVSALAAPEVVAEICRRLDGIPLALELAAARLQLVSPAQLLELLDQRFRLLVGGRRALPRQQTLATVIQWSHDHLRPEEQRLLQHLAVCAGGCDLDAAAALSGRADDRPALLDGLARLADLSLLEVQHADGAPRYLLLETVRQFALERLHEGGLLAEARERHARHFLAVARQVDADIEAHGEGAHALDRLDRERDNLLRAIDHWDRADDPAAACAGLELVAALRYHWPARGLLPAGLRVTRRALEHAAALPHDRSQVLAMGALTLMLRHVGAHDDALAVARRLADRALDAGDDDGLAIAQAHLGNIAGSLGRTDEARMHLEAALALATARGDLRRQGDALNGLAAVNRIVGRLDEADAQCEQVLQMRRAAGHVHQIATALLNIASASLDRRATTRARDGLLEALDLLPRVGSRYLVVHALGMSGTCLGQCDRWAQAVELLAVAHTLWRELGLHVDPTTRQERDLELAAAQAALSAEAFESAWAAGLALPEAEALALARRWLAAT